MSSRNGRRVRLSLEQLEDRDVPSSSSCGFSFADANHNGVPDSLDAAIARFCHDFQNHSASHDGLTAIQANLGSTPIAAGSTVWFSSVFHASGLGSAPVTLHFTGQTISYALNGSTVTVNVPDSVITLSPTATSASTSFDPVANAWVTTLPSRFSGDAFLSGFALQLPNGLPHGLKSVTWQGHMTSDTAGVTVNWQWGAAVYKSFSTDYNALHIKPIDGNHLSPYRNSDNAGTPEAFKNGLAGGHGSCANYTGSQSDTARVKPPVVQQQNQAPSLSGHILDPDGNGVGTITINLEDSSGNIIATTTSAADGSYSFTGLQPGTYQLVAAGTRLWIGTGEQVGTVNGSADGSDLGNLTIGNINLVNGNAGVNYNFIFSAAG